MAERRKQGEHERAVRRDLRRLPAEDRQGAQAQLALTLACRIDEGDASLRDLASISAQYQAILTTLAKKQEPAAVLDPVDELAKRRRERRLGRDAAGG